MTLLKEKETEQNWESKETALRRLRSLARAIPSKLETVNGFKNCCELTAQIVPEIYIAI
jgi:hypothetical protein